MQYPAVVESSHFEPGKFDFAYSNDNYEKKSRESKEQTHLNRLPLCVRSSIIAIFINYILPVPISISTAGVKLCVGMEQKKGIEK